MFMENLVLNQALPSLLLNTTQFFERTFQTDEFVIRDKMAVILVYRIGAVGHFFFPVRG